MINLRDLDTRITLERPEKALDASGEEVVTYSTMGRVWAQVLPVSGSESFAALQRYAEVTHRFRVRWRGDLTPENRVVHDGRTSDVVEVLEVERREFLEIRATARAE